MLVDFLFDLTDLTLDFEGANSKLLDVVVLLMLILSVDNRLVGILKLKFGRDFEPDYIGRGERKFPLPYIPANESL